jgi:phosphoglycerol transferase MdoB-like AlkP superfamily enzyme
VITADHTSEGYYPYYLTNLGQYAVPLLFFLPGGDLKGFSPLTAQQTDIMPTVLNYMGYDRDYLAFGSDLFDSTAAHFSVRYTNGLYGLVKDGYYYEFNGTQGTSLFDLSKDKLQRQNVIKTEKEVNARLEQFMKAFIQQYSNRVIENRLIIDNVEPVSKK